MVGDELLQIVQGAIVVEVVRWRSSANPAAARASRCRP
jgi:hypothetical protein